MLERCYIGTYSETIVFGSGETLEGRGIGVHILSLDTGSGELEPVCPPFPAPNPSYLAASPDGRFLYAVHELKTWEGRAGGAASAYAVEAGGLRLLSRQPTHGEDPCHISLSPDGRWALASNFSGGCVTVFPVGADGALLPPSHVLRHQGRSVHPQMQAGPHPHMARFYQDRVLVSDLGLDRLFAYRLEDGRLVPGGPPFACSPGSGPRHFDIGNSMVYLLHELDGTIAVLDGSRKPVQRRSLLPPGMGGEPACADLHLAPDGRFLWASVRGDDSLVCFPVGADGLLGQPSRFSCGGHTPRSFALDPSGRFLLCANQDSGNVAWFRVDGGELAEAGSISIPNPVCVLVRQ